MAHRERWTHADEVLALILEKLDELTIVTRLVWADPKSTPPKPPKPFRYPRPDRWSPPAPKVRTPTPDIIQFFRSRR